MGVFKMGKMTFGSLFKKPETVLYPVETKPQPAGLKGHIEIDVERCILCGICEKGCPTNCIAVDKPGNTWSIQSFQCIQCGYCTRSCPKGCLHMDPNYWKSSVSKELRVYEVPAKEQKKKASADAGSNAAKGADKKLEDKLATMDPAKAEKVRAALAAKEAKAKAGKASQSDKPAAKAEAGAEEARAERAKAANADEELMAKIAIMDPERAAVVRKAIEARSSS